jgi:NADH:ubiquinone oxidoreductase subunit D
LSFGPNHPAAHGVLSCIVYLLNEYITGIDVNIGYLHRGTEKLLQFKSTPQSLPYFDRLDYVSVVFNEHMFVLAFEAVMLYSIPLRVSVIRVCFLEITRVFNGLLAISCNIFDLGAMSPMLWSFEERDKIMTFFDYVCGVRMHVSYICIGGVLEDLSPGLIDKENVLRWEGNAWNASWVLFLGLEKF